MKTIFEKETRITASGRVRKTFARISENASGFVLETIQRDGEKTVLVSDSKSMKDFEWFCVLAKLALRGC